MNEMPAFRNVKSRRSSGRIWNKVPIVYDEQGWETLPSVADYPRHEISSPHSSATSPSTTSADSDFENRLVRKSKGKSNASHPSNEHVPRPKNAFIFYRSYYYQTLGGSDQNQISVAAGKAWKALGDEEKLPFQLMAEKEKRDHQARFPHYTYAPGCKGGSAKRKTAAKKKTHSSAKRAFLPKPKPTTRRPSRTHNAPSTRDPSPPAEIVLPTLLQLQPSPVASEASEPMLDLTNEDAPADPENLFTYDWSFIPTSDIPPLELPPAKSEKEPRSEMSTLRPPSYEYIGEQFMPNPVAVPVTVESFFAGAPLAEGLHYNYADVPDFSVLSSNSPEESSSALDWTMVTAGTSQEIIEPSYSDYLLFTETPRSDVYALYDPSVVHEAHHEGKFRMSPPVSPHTIPSHDNELEMEQYINYYF